uniref:Uncharacterized protein n=1 Tax=Seriola dumerili TaxID=41447 RepID=A0A3B4VLM5_SERDU
MDLLYLTQTVFSPLIQFVKSFHVKDLILSGLFGDMGSGCCCVSCNNPGSPEGDVVREKYLDKLRIAAVVCALLQNPGYYDIVAEDMSLWHVLNNFPLEHWNLAAILFYHTDNCFLQNITKIHTFIQQYPMRYNVGSCCNRRPAIPIVYIHGDGKSTRNLWTQFKRTKNTCAITFRVINNEHAAMGSVSQQRDLPSLDLDRLARSQGWSASKEMSEAAPLLFYC